jgi:hypothetical protein
MRVEDYFSNIVDSNDNGYNYSNETYYFFGILLYYYYYYYYYYS